MLLSVNEAATLLGCSRRAVRARLVRGDLKGQKDGGQWRVVRDSLPMSAEQHRALQTRANDIREMVEGVLPAPSARTPGDRTRTLGDLAAFAQGAKVLRALRQPPAEGVPSPSSTAAAVHLEAALVALGRAWPIFHPPTRLRLLDEARSSVGAAMAILLLDEGAQEREPTWVTTLEQQMLPPLAGMCRAAERRGDDNAARRRG